MRITKFFVLAVIALSAMEARATGQTLTEQEVRYIGTGWSAEGIYIDTVAANTSVDGCGPRFIITPTHPMLDEMVSLLLSAFHTNTKVNLYVDGCASPTVMQLKAVAITK